MTVGGLAVETDTKESLCGRVQLANCHGMNDHRTLGRTTIQIPITIVTKLDPSGLSTAMECAADAREASESVVLMNQSNGWLAFAPLVQFVLGLEARNLHAGHPDRMPGVGALDVPVAVAF